VRHESGLSFFIYENEKRRRIPVKLEKYFVHKTTAANRGLGDMMDKGPTDDRPTFFGQ
jgi:hypothetical protein